MAKIAKCGKKEKQTQLTAKIAEMTNPTNGKHLPNMRKRKTNPTDS